MTATGRPLFTVVMGATRPGFIRATIDSIQRQTLEDWELIAVGQGDDAVIREMVNARSKSDSRIRYAHTVRMGLSRARNAGVRAAQGAWVAMIDDDCEAAPDWLATLAGRIDANPEIGMIGGSMLAPPRPAGHRFARCPHWEPPEVLFDPAAHMPLPAGFGIAGGNFAFRRDLASTVGSFDERLGVGAEFPAAEEIDFLLRTLRCGIQVLATPAAVVHHTDGWRFGFRMVLRHQRQRGLGNGALAAKRLMAGDAQGRAELEALIHRWISGFMSLRRPEGLWYTPHFWLGYRRCMRNYALDANGTLTRRLREAWKSASTRDAVP